MIGLAYFKTITATFFKSTAPTFFKGGVAISILGILVATGLAFKQSLEGPIAIRPFTLEDAGTPGIFAAALADQVKADVSDIYSESGDLFEVRKLGNPTVPLNVKLGNSGWDLQSLASAFGVSLTSADVSGRILKDPDGLTLQWTILKSDGVKVDSILIPKTTAPMRTNIDRALQCLALRTVAGLSPDVAANYLHRESEINSDDDGKAASCLGQDDVGLYSQVSEDGALPPATRVNALVGLSVYFSTKHQLFEELNMAKAATSLASRTISCDARRALPTVWQRLKCRWNAYRPFSDKNQRAEIAAWMQLGAAYSDMASEAPTLSEMQKRRRRSIEAYKQVIAIKGDYAPAYDAKGLQHFFITENDDAIDAYNASLRAGETPAAHLDLAFAYIHGRNDLLDGQLIMPGDLKRAEREFRRATELSPDYWDAYSGLGYVLYRSEKLPEAANVLEAALEHDSRNRDLRLLLGRTYARQCRFDDAKKIFASAYVSFMKSDPASGKSDPASGADVASDWGKLLDESGFPDWAINQESEVLANDPENVDAYRVRGEAKLEVAGSDPLKVAGGLADLEAAVKHDSSKSDRVLNAYLVGLLQTGQASEAIATYERWSRDGIVPPLASTSHDSVIFPATPNARLTYAKALLQTHQRERSERELEVLFRQGIIPRASQSASVDEQAPRVHAAEATLTRIDAPKSDGPPPPPVQPDKKPNCRRPAELPLLIGNGALMSGNS